MNDEPELLPCPFCGGAAAIHVIAPSEYCAICSACGSNGKVFIALMDDVRHLVIEQWNTRTIPTPPEPRTTGLTFGEALAAMREGKKMARENWNHWVSLRAEGSCIEYPFGTGSLAWTPFQCDLLATDWYIVTGE